MRAELLELPGPLTMARAICSKEMKRAKEVEFYPE